MTPPWKTVSIYKRSKGWERAFEAPSKKHTNRWLDATARGPVVFGFFVVVVDVPPTPTLAPGTRDSHLGVSESSDLSLARLLSGPRAEGYSSL